jgi:hypothetical protein
MNEVLSNVSKAIKLAGISLQSGQLQVQDLGCPHTPTALPFGKMAVYIFRHGDTVLKVGKVGPNSSPRFQSQHYLPGSSKSNLAKSLLNDDRSPCRDLSVEEVGRWMRKNLHRIDLLLDADLGIPALAFLEAFLHCCYAPRYEGYKTQTRNA